jgi:two-component system cell cycle sensor histidine kinase PleC
VASLNPADACEARKLDAQLGVVRASIRLFDYTFPPASALMAFVQLEHVALWRIGPFWLLFVATCVLNEFLLGGKRAPGADYVAGVRADARRIATLTFVFTVMWSAFVFSMLRLDFPISNLFLMLVMSGTLAAVSTRFAAHTASVAGPLFLIALFVLPLEFTHGFGHHFFLFQLSLLYIALMTGQARAIHRRFEEGWRLEREREDLIENLRGAKAESDLAHERAVAASRAKSEFLANMSHELRTPLNAIIGFSDIVRTKAFGESDARYPEYADFIHQSGNHLLQLIGDILDLAKIEAGSKTLHEEPIDLAGLVIDEARSAQEKAVAKRIHVARVLPKELPLLQADLYAVRKILENLLSNAVKFTPEGGRIEVAAFVNADREIEILVGDTGPGIAGRDQAHFFQRFGEGLPHITSAQRGSGLGLPIVKGLADMHEARLVLDSAPGKGTRITLIFPAARTLSHTGRRVA